MREPAAGLTQKLATYFRNKAQESDDPVAFVYSAVLENNLAVRLSDLRRREDALQAAEEAVRLRRALAEVRPDAFAVELARSLWVLGDLCGETEKPDLAVGTLAEAIQLLTPIFLDVPAAVIGMMAEMLQSYLVQCQAVGHEPDAELLGPVLTVFETLTQKEDKA